MQRQWRLRSRADFARLRREGRVFRHPAVTLSLAANELPHNRYGFITAKHLGKAVVRNRVRRRLREVIRQMHPQLSSGFDMVFIVRPPLVEQPMTKVAQIVGDVLRKAGLV
jgi:ribonuclease P protein component